MARLNRNSVFTALSGSIGKELVFKQYPNKVVVGQYPDMSRIKPSERQKENRQKMKEATAYALSILHNPKLRTAFERTLKPGESVYHKAIKQYFEKLKSKS